MAETWPLFTVAVDAHTDTTVEHLIMHTGRNGPKAMHYENYAILGCHVFVTSVTSFKM